MAGFDPYAYLAGSGNGNSAAFDPDAYLKSSPSQGDTGERTGGFWRNALLGLEEVPSGLMQFGYDIANNLPIAPGILDVMTAKRGANGQIVSGAQEGVQKAGQKVTSAIGSVTGVTPENTSRNTFTDKFGHVLGGTAPYLFNPEGGAVSMLRNAAVGTGLAAGQAGAEEVFPESPVAQTVGGLIGATLTHQAMRLPGRIQAMNLSPEQQGTNYVLNTAASAGKTPADIGSFNTAGKPYIGAEAIGTPGITATRALAIRQGTTGNQLRPLLEERAEGQGPRILTDYATATGIDPELAQGNISAVVKSGQEVAKPYYEKAMAGSGTGAFEGPLTQQLDIHSKAVNTAKQAVADAENQMTLAERKLHDAGDNVYGVNSANQDKAAAQRQLDQANSQLDVATKAHDEVNARLEQAQADNANGVKGGMWSPRLQQFLDDPVFKQAMGRGLKLQRLEALEEGKPFNPRDWAVTGTDAEGNPIVSGVPNMDLLDSTKRGVDAMINDYRDKTTGVLNTRDPMVQRLIGVKNAYLGELDKLNPDYAKARSVASDYLSAEDAFNRAQKMFGNPNVTDAQFNKFLDGLGDTNREAAKGGVANWLFNQANQGRLRGNNFSKPILMKKLRGIVADPEKSADLLMKMDAEAQMAKSGARMHPGLNSTTAESEEAMSVQDMAGPMISAGKALYYGGKGNIVSGAANAWQALERLKALGRTRGLNEAGRNEAGRLMMMSPEQLGNHLEQYQAAHAAAQSRLPRIRPLTMLPAFMPSQPQGDNNQ